MRKDGEPIAQDEPDESSSPPPIWYTSSGLDSGWSYPIHRRRIKAQLSSEIIDYVSFDKKPNWWVEPSFKTRGRLIGYVYMSVLKPGIGTMPYPEKWKHRRASLYIYAVRDSLLQDERWPDLSPMFETIRADVLQWQTAPDTHLLHQRIVGFFINDFKLFIERAEK